MPIRLFGDGNQFTGNIISMDYSRKLIDMDACRNNIVTGNTAHIGARVFAYRVQRLVRQQHQREHGGLESMGTAGSAWPVACGARLWLAKSRLSSAHPSSTKDQPRIIDDDSHYHR